MRPRDPGAVLPPPAPTGTIVLRVGDACGVLLSTAARNALERTATAQAALRAHTGRADIMIGRRSSGRPNLAPPYPELGGTLSHRDDLILAGFSPTQRVGADIEIDTPALDARQLAADHFTQAEAAAIRRLVDAAARDAFLRLWVAKEAALKLTGRGIYDGLDEPDLAPHIDVLMRDDLTIDVAASARLPALQLTVCRVALTGRPDIYCALAVEAA